MKKLIVLTIFVLLFSILGFTTVNSETIDIKDYIKGKLPVIFNIYLSSFGEIDEYEKEFMLVKFQKCTI